MFSYICANTVFGNYKGKGSKTLSAERDKGTGAETQNRVKLERNMLKRKDRKENQVAGKQDIEMK